MIDERLVGLKFFGVPTGSSVHPLACMGFLSDASKGAIIPIVPLGHKEAICDTLVIKEVILDLPRL